MPGWWDVIIPVVTLALYVLYRFDQMQDKIDELQKKIGEQQHERR